MAIQQIPIVRNLVRAVLAPLDVNRRIPRTEYKVRFPAAQYLGWLGPRAMNRESQIAQHFHERIRRGDTVVDVGANVGVYTMLSACLVGPGGHVHAFEPDPQSLSYLVRNVSDNRVNDRVSLWGVALADQMGAATLHLDTKTARTTSLREHAFSLDRQQRRPLSVLTSALDDLVHDPIAFIKIDVEGAEMAVLRGAERIIGVHRPVLLVEVLANHLDEVDGYLGRFGYEIVDAHTRRPVELGTYSGNICASIPGAV